jgi:hypothetical protein
MQHRCLKRTFLVFASVVRGSKTSLASERTVESTTECWYVWCRFLKHTDCGLRDTSNGPVGARKRITGNGYRFQCATYDPQVGRGAVSVLVSGTACVRVQPWLPYLSPSVPLGNLPYPFLTAFSVLHTYCSMFLRNRSGLK